MKAQYTKNIHGWRHSKKGKPGCVNQEIWDNWQKYWSTPEWIEKAHKDKKNHLSETGGPGSGVTKHTCGSRSLVEHSLKLVNN